VGKHLKAAALVRPESVTPRPLCYGELGRSSQQLRANARERSESSSQSSWRFEHGRDGRTHKASSVGKLGIACCFRGLLLSSNPAACAPQARQTRRCRAWAQHLYQLPRRRSLPETHFALKQPDDVYF
jgi:hypothetical protein